MEIWKKIESKERYSVSNFGNIRNDKTGRILRQRISTSGYYTVMLGRKTNPIYVHRLVASAFIENPENKPQVDHIDGNKLNNNAENLRWLSVSENCFAYGYKARIENRKKKVIAINGDKEIIFDSRDEAAKYFGCNKSNIKYNKVFKKGNKKGWMFSLFKI